MHQSSFAFASIPRSGASLLAPLAPLLPLTPLPLLDAAQQVQKNRWDPQQKLLLLVRDPRALLLSRHPAFPRQPFFGFDHSLHLPPDWITFSHPGLLDHFAAAQHLREAAGIDLRLDLLCLRFEDLLSNPQREKNRLHHFTGLPLKTLDQHLPLPPQPHSVPSWQLPQNARRIIRQFQLQPALFDLLETWGYEPNTSWFDQLTHSAPDALHHRQGHIVGYFTEGNHYVQEANRLLASVQRLGIPIQLTPIPNQGDWLANVRFKVRFLTELRKNLRGPLLYVDVDAILHKDPWPYLDTLDCDVAFCAFRDGKARSGTIYLDDTPGAALFLQDWQRRLDQAPDAWDQIPFNDFTREQLSTSHPAFRVQFLPPELCYIFDRDAQSQGTLHAPIVEHLQASREKKEGPKLQRRRSRIEELEGNLPPVSPQNGTAPPPISKEQIRILIQEANALVQRNQWEAATSAFCVLAELARKQRDANTLVVVGDTLERLGCYHQAWTALADAATLKVPKHPSTGPEWAGQNLAGHSIHVERRMKHTGAELRMARLLPLAVQQGARVSASVEARLVPLLRRSFPEVTILPTGTMPPWRPDFFASYERLAQFLIPDHEAIARSFRPLVPDYLLRAELQAGYPQSDLPRIGLAWHSTNPKKDLPSLSRWARWIQNTPATYVSLQYQEAEAGIAELEQLAHQKIVPSGSINQLRDLDGFAAQVASVDYVLCISNTTAHMAGALGIPTTVLLDTHNHLTWPTLHSRTPFFPLTKLVRKNTSSWDFDLHHP